MVLRQVADCPCLTRSRGARLSERNALVQAVADPGIEFGKGTWRAPGGLGAEPPAGSRGSQELRVAKPL